MNPIPPRPNKPQRKQKPVAEQMLYAKIPPQATDLEAAVLGVILLEKDKLPDVMRIIRSQECFYHDAHQKIYGAVLRLNMKGMIADLLTVTEELRRTSQLDVVGGGYYLTKLTMSVVNSAKVEDHARLVMEKFMLREIIRIGGEAIAAAYEGAEDVFDQLDKVQIDFGGINDFLRTGSIKSFGQSLKHALDDMAAAAMRTDELLGLPSGLTRLDRIMDGFVDPDLITIAAGTGEGKTTLALNFAEHIASQGDPVGFFSLEMKDKQLVWKILSGKVEESIRSVRRGKLTDEKWQRIWNNHQLFRLPIYLYDKGGLNIVELKAIARTMVQKFGVRILFVDYIQLVRGAGKKFGTREEEVNYVSKELKALAMELNVPIIMLSQLNRLEKGTKRMYRLSDLRESGAIEQDSDAVMFVYRPTLHDLKEMNVGGQDMSFTDGDALIDIAKCRLGETGTFRVRYDGAFNRFSDYEVNPFDEQAAAPEQMPFSPALIAASRQVRDFSQPISEQHAPGIDDFGEELPF